MTCNTRWNREIFTNIQICAIFTTTTEQRWVVGGGEREVSKKKKKNSYFLLYVYFSLCCQMCQALHLFVRACALLLSLTMYFSLAESLYLLWGYTSIHLLLLSHHVKSVVLGSTQSSLLISTTFLLLQPLSSPLSQVSSHLPANSSLVNTFSHKFTSHSTGSTSLPLSCACLQHYPFYFFFLLISTYPYPISSWPLTTPLLRPQHPSEEQFYSLFSHQRQEDCYSCLLNPSI